MIIDEPNSFLHPGATRTLLDIFRDYPQHQFILSTHSPEVLAAARPTTWNVVRQWDGASTVESFSLDDISSTRRLFEELGIKLSDVFSSDRVLWVEGRTEELCFPLITNALLRSPPERVAFVGVINTGDFENRDADRIFRIYERLSRANALVPPAIGYLFDGETHTKETKERIASRSAQAVRFLERRSFENYLLNPSAIESVIAKELTGLDITNKPTKEQVSQWLSSHLTDAGYTTNL